jgi:hypothetical protein
MISLQSAIELKNIGFEWKPVLHDFFAIPDRGMDNRLFVISDMLANTETLFGVKVVSFQGASEWALDYLVSTEAVWMPTEEQLRESLENMLVSEKHPEITLSSRLGQCRCEIPFNGETMTFETGDASEAYARALMYLLQAYKTQKEEES